MASKPLPARSRAGTYATFERRYGPIAQDDGSILRRWDDPRITKAFDEDYHYVWTVVEGDSGRLYLVPGFATINYIARVLCERPWPESEELAPGYVYS